MTFVLKPLLAGSALALLAAAAFAQEPTPPADAASAPATAPATPDAARAALGKQEGDVDQAKLLKDTLTSQDKQYSLIRKGTTALTYDLTYSYTGQQTIDFDQANSTLTGISDVRGHTLTNTFSVDYGIENNVTGNITIPFVSRYSQQTGSVGEANAFGDLALGVRLQPFPLGRDVPALTATGTLRLPTGRSPFKTIQGQDLSTGAGYASFTAGINASKIVDPVALFGSLNLTLSAPAKHLSQQNIGGTEVLSEVRPGPTLGWGVGFAYAMSYDISTTVSFQQAISARSKLTLTSTGASSSPGGAAAGTVTQANTAGQTSASLNFGLGVRTSPLTTINFNVGIGLTPDTPDFTFGMNMPLHF
jgi:hypothetical protein